MFKHILLPSDGSAASDVAVRAGLRLAKDLGATVTALNVVPQFHVFSLKAELIEDTPEEFVKESSAQSQKILADIESAAAELGVPCDALQRVSDHPYQVIIDAARDTQCDLIVMASHGRKGVQGVLLGSETQKVLVHSAIPVLVFR
jgi:nucleotide-binding universal stress UspA family protein